MPVGAPISLVALGFLAVCLAFLPQKGSLAELTQALEGDTSGSQAKLPLSFIPNRGQTDGGRPLLRPGSGIRLLLHR
jgi:hypothetical protein